MVRKREPDYDLLLGGQRESGGGDAPHVLAELRGGHAAPPIRMESSLSTALYDAGTIAGGISTARQPTCVNYLTSTQNSPQR